MGTHPIFESDFDCLTDQIRIIKKLKWLHERERPRKSKKLSLWDPRSLKAKTFSVLLTSTPHSTILSSMLPISPERKPWSVLPVVCKSRLIVMSHLHMLLCWLLKMLLPVQRNWESPPFISNSELWVVPEPNLPDQVPNKLSELWPVLV